MLNLSAGRPTALIFGISGQDGAYLSHLLLSKGYAVHGVARDADGSSFERLERVGIRDRVMLYSGDLRDFRSSISLITKIEPTEIYNLSGQSSVARSFELPVETFESVSVGTINLLECLRMVSAPIRMFQAVSSECFGNTDTPACETTALLPRSPYAMAKAAAFWSASTYREAYGLHICSGILSNHESPLRPARFVTRKVVHGAGRIAAGHKERLVLGNLETHRDWGWAPEYVDAMWRTLQQPAPSDFVIATGETRSLRDLVAAVFAEFGLNMDDHVDIDDALMRPSEVDRTLLNPSRAKKELDWSATSRMSELCKLLVDCERTGLVGPVPWASGQIGVQQKDRQGR
jgi:GDPmannose 4,6-dehydratase